jgi:glutaredoxin
MDKIIEVNIYGIGEYVIETCCSKTDKDSGKASVCGGSCSGCPTSKKTIEAFTELDQYLRVKGISDDVSLNFIEADEEGMLGHEELRELMRQGFTLPIIVIDEIPRYYGGISKDLIYKDILELREYYVQKK